MNTKNVLATVILLGLLQACLPAKKPEINLDKIKQEVIDNDLAFSNFSKEHGFAKALAEYAAENAIKLNPRAYSTFGKENLLKEANADSLGSSQGAITWEPKKVHLSESGDLAAAFGDWYFTLKSPITLKDTTLYGNYITVWKKQADGSWKFVLDGGNPVPGPTKEEMLALLEKPTK